MNKIKTALSIVACCAACVGGLHGQGTFANFDFELAGSTLPSSVTNIAPPNPVSADQAFPGWWVYYGSSLQPIVSYNSVSLGAASVSLQGPGQYQSYNIAGSYTALLQSGFVSPDGFIAVSLAQTGLIPIGAEYLQMKVHLPFSDTFQVTFGGQPISMAPAASGPNYTLYSGYIANYAGQSAELRITALPAAGPTAGWMYLDDIIFAVPEPSSFALLLVGGMGALALARAKKRLEQ